ncbi:complex I subunit 4 family protein [Taibaiella koreensis]|uniref:complex I subunit 4 family protein n=1 Tax=Taibaiella koreensis TaxID=1268548 RepID=UPI000E59D721|nr:NADH-quinone oxidoreductase subunit M [Taibaiella koreensis]
MILLLLILVPFVTGLISFTWKHGSVKTWALGASLMTLAIAFIACAANSQAMLVYNVPWIPSLGARFWLFGNGMSVVLALLTAIVFPVIFISQRNKPVEDAHRFYGLMLLSQAGLMGVFLAHDLLLFYFFWELALIPVYFLCSTWGGERRIPVTFKFFVYTFMGSLLMLAGVIYLYLQTPGRTFDWDTIRQTGASLPAFEQGAVFCLFFIAFGIKMPVFPFHTWQPDTYEQSSTPVTIVLSALMVKMGLFATVKWLVNILPEGTVYWTNTVMVLSVIGIIYASLLAMVQSDIKRLIAYSSIAHIGLMSLGIFANDPNGIAMNGLVVQMFNHGINITGMWLIVSMIEQRYGTRNLRELGGMAGSAPTMAIALVIIAFANIALPLTNGFIGEFMLFHGIFQSENPYHITFMVLAGLGVIFGAVYTLNMVQKVAYGEAKTAVVVKDVSSNELFGLIVIIGIILLLGVYPKLLFGIMG